MGTNEKKLAKEEKVWAQEKELLQREYNLKEDKKNFKNSKKKKMSMSKKLICFLFINCTLIELFVGWVTIKSLNISMVTMYAADLSPLVALVGAVVGEVIGYAVYAIKSARENTVNGITYMYAEHELKKQDTVG